MYYTPIYIAYVFFVLHYSKKLVIYIKCNVWGVARDLRNVWGVAREVKVQKTSERRYA